MPLSREEFIREWTLAGESQSELIIDTAYRLYQHRQSPDHPTKLELSEPTLDDLKVAFEPVLSHLDLEENIAAFKFVTIPANNIPWLATGILVGEDQAVSVLPTGRTWRSKLLDLYLPPQVNLWYRIGVNGDVFNSTHDTRTFKCIPGQSGELYLANQVPGQFGSQKGGRLQTNLSVYEKAEGSFQALIIQWQRGLEIRPQIYGLLGTMKDICEQLGRPDPYGLLSTARRRFDSDYYAHHFPVGWTLLWFLGVSEVFTQEEDTPKLKAPGRSAPAGQQQLLSPVDESLDPISPGSDGGSLIQTRSQAPPPVIRCLPNHNVGILQKDLSPIYEFTPSTQITWSWNIPSLPSRLREDTTLTHDYLSLALEFENGRDLTYTWSWELPVEFGYWCPIPSWCDREYHVVIKSGTAELGTWLNEKRDVWTDYMKYINGGDATRKMPTQVVKVWLIAGNRWQRHRGEMLIKGIVLRNGYRGPERVVL